MVSGPPAAPVVPGGLGGAVGPEAAPLVARLVLEMREPRIAGVLPEPPGEALPHELLVEAPPIRERHLAEEPPIAVVPGHPDRDGLPERLLRRELLGPLTEGLPLLGRVDPDEPDSRGAA